MTDQTAQPEPPSPEALVRGIRAARAAEEWTEVNLLTGKLLKASEPGIQAVANRFFLPAEARDELRDRVNAKVWEKVSGDDTFWERRFGFALRRTALNEVRALIRHRPFYDIGDVPLAMLGYGFRATSNPVELNLRYARLRRCIGSLPQAEKRAVILRHFHGLLIEAADESVSTVSGIWVSPPGQCGTIWSEPNQSWQNAWAFSPAIVSVERSRRSCAGRSDLEYPSGSPCLLSFRAREAGMRGRDLSRRRSELEVSIEELAARSGLGADDLARSESRPRLSAPADRGAEARAGRRR